MKHKAIISEIKILYLNLNLFDISFVFLHASLM